MGRLDGKKALITGSSRGIGAGIARAFAREGADVAINYPSPSEASEAEDLRVELLPMGCRAIAVEADVSDEAASAALAERALEAMGRVDILVNNAGIAHTAPLEEISVSDWDRVLSVHLRGTFLVTKHILPAMYEVGHGRIINTASQLAYKGAPGFTHYTAAKGAIISLTRSLALEAAPKGVTVNCVAPGATKTAILEDVDPDVLEAIRQAIPLGRLAEVGDIVGSYVFLASDEAGHYVGQVLSPNGGDAFF